MHLQYICQRTSTIINRQRVAVRFVVFWYMFYEKCEHFFSDTQTVMVTEKKEEKYCNQGLIRFSP